MQNPRTRAALQDAASIGVLLTTEAVIADEPENKVIPCDELPNGVFDVFDPLRTDLGVQKGKDPVTVLTEREVLMAVLAGHRGHCGDYKSASGFGQTQQPFTWLSSSVEEDVESLAGDLQMFKRTREAVWFEARELVDEQWRVVLSGNVRVLYSEVDSTKSKVRALLQWAPNVASSQLSGSSQSPAR